MKHVARIADRRRAFAFRRAGELPQALEIEHVGSGQKYKLESRFDEQGIAESTWTIPQEAKLGTYSLSWTGAPGAVERELPRRSVSRAADARGARAAEGAAVKPAAVKLDAAVTYLSGGPAANLPVKVRYRVEERTVDFRDYSDFQLRRQTA